MLVWKTGSQRIRAVRGIAGERRRAGGRGCPGGGEAVRAARERAANALGGPKRGPSCRGDEIRCRAIKPGGCTLCVRECPRGAARGTQPLIGGGEVAAGRRVHAASQLAQRPG